jgi:hypothetical protein
MGAHKRLLGISSTGFKSSQCSQDSFFNCIYLFIRMKYFAMKIVYKGVLFLI